MRGKLSMREQLNDEHIGWVKNTLVIIIVCKWIKGLNAPTNIINDLRTETSLALAKMFIANEEKKDFINNPGIKA